MTAATSAGPPASRVPPYGRRRFAVLNAVLIVVILVLDWLTPAGIVVGFLLVLPIVAMSLSDRRGAVWWTGGVAILGFIIAAVYGSGPIAPREVWLTNRVFVLFLLPATTLLSAWLRRVRQEAQAARDRALAAGRMNRLLVSVLAHDLRAPLGLSTYALDYIRATPPEEVDGQLIEDVDARLRRTLSHLDRLLAATADGDDTDLADGPTRLPVAHLVQELTDEALSYEAEARVRGKTLDVRTAPLSDREVAVDLLMLRQALALLLDGAVRASGTAPIQVRISASANQLEATVGGGPSTEAGADVLGLALARSLADHLGGRVAYDDGVATLSVPAPS